MCPAGTGVHWPQRPGSRQLTQGPLQALLQQTPSVQNPDSHSGAASQVAPAAFLPQLPSWHTSPAHWLLLVQRSWQRLVAGVAAVGRAGHGDRAPRTCRRCTAWRPTSELPWHLPGSHRVPSGKRRQPPRPLHRPSRPQLATGSRGHWVGITGASPSGTGRAQAGRARQVAGHAGPAAGAAAADAVDAAAGADTPRGSCRLAQSAFFSRRHGRRRSRPSGARSRRPRRRRGRGARRSTRPPPSRRIAGRSVPERDDAGDRLGGAGRERSRSSNGEREPAGRIWAKFIYVFLTEAETPPASSPSSHRTTHAAYRARDDPDRCVPDPRRCARVTHVRVPARPHRRARLRQRPDRAKRCRLCG